MLRLEVLQMQDIYELEMLCQMFYDESGYNVGYDSDHMISKLEQSIGNPNYCSLILKTERGTVVGMLIGVVTDHIFCPIRVATELAWYVHPDFRGAKEAIKMMQAFEYWAKEVGHADQIVMVSLEKVEPVKVDSIYKRLGFNLVEHGYMKELK